ncbi:MAG: hypothetical protein J6R85_06825 [Lentisphaeria bacterium]|nr:hypothetical protein [Lentisphaeria bacterium]
MNPSIERLWGNAGSFLSDTETPDDIAISTRIRLARNLAGFPFPSTGTPEQSLAVRECVREAASDARILPEMLQFDVPDLSAQEREFLFERRLASRELLNSHPAGA